MFSGRNLHLWRFFLDFLYRPKVSFRLVFFFFAVSFVVPCVRPFTLSVNKGAEVRSSDASFGRRAHSSRSGLFPTHPETVSFHSNDPSSCQRQRLTFPFGHPRPTPLSHTPSTRRIALVLVVFGVAARALFLAHPYLHFSFLHGSLLFRITDGEYLLIYCFASGTTSKTLHFVCMYVWV